MKYGIIKTASLILICSMLCACSSGGEQTTSNTETTTNTILQTASPEESTTSSTYNDAVTTTTENTQSPSQEIDWKFYPILTEDDIEYKGIPYKDLTKEQFMEMFGQCTKENNLQKLYVLYYDNTYDSHMTKEEAELFGKEKIIEWIKHLALHEGISGCMWSVYENPRLEECGQQEDDLSFAAPEGYYDYSDDEDVEKAYLMISDYKMYTEGELTREFPNDICWITLRRINGYWKIGLSFFTSPPTRDFMKNLDRRFEEYQNVN